MFEVVYQIVSRWSIGTADLWAWRFSLTFRNLAKIQKYIFGKVGSSVSCLLSNNPIIMLLTPVLADIRTLLYSLSYHLSLSENFKTVADLEPSLPTSIFDDQESESSGTLHPGQFEVAEGDQVAVIFTEVDKDVVDRANIIVPQSDDAGDGEMALENRSNMHNRIEMKKVLFKFERDFDLVF